MITGTNCFVSFAAACRYYEEYGIDEEGVRLKIEGGEIIIGKPTLKAGEKLILLDEGMRYGILKGGGK